MTDMKKDTIMGTVEESEKNSTIDKRINTEMMHPLFGRVLVTDIRETSKRTYAYFDKTVCNIIILEKINEKNN